MELSDEVYEVFGYLSARQFIEEHEKDRYEWEYRGYKLEVVRQQSLGHLCAYLDLRHCPFDFEEAKEIANQLFHCGVTYEHKQMIGFDCAHYEDICPQMPHSDGTYFWGKSSYKTYAYAKRKLESSVDEILERLWC